MKTRDDTIEAIRDLVLDLQQNQDYWPNAELSEYLEAMAAWLDGYGKKHDPAPSWDLIIQMLSAAKIYE
jgi:hypothetical protein